MLRLAPAKIHKSPTVLKRLPCCGFLNQTRESRLGEYLYIYHKGTLRCEKGNCLGKRHSFIDSKHLTQIISRPKVFEICLRYARAYLIQCALMEANWCAGGEKGGSKKGFLSYFSFQFASKVGRWRTFQKEPIKQCALTMKTSNNWSWQCFVDINISSYCRFKLWFPTIVIDGHGRKGWQLFNQPPQLCLDLF